MTPPRRILPGTPVMVTVRCTGRSLRLLPHRKIVDTIEFCFAATLSKFDIQVHEYCFLSNHFHIALTPLNDDLPAFMQEFSSLLSRALNAVRGWSGSNIEPGYNISVQADDRTAVRQCAYILANPCAADLVARISHWHGPNSFRLEYGEDRVIKRPKFGLWKPVDAPRRHRKRAWDSHRRSFRGRWVTPERATITLTRPRAYVDQLSDVLLRKQIRDEALTRQANAEEKRRKAGRKAMGMRRVLRQDWWAIPRSKEDLFGPEPKVAASSYWSRKQAVERDRAYERDYRTCIKAWTTGERKVVFPAGTYLMRVRYGVQCANAPPG